MTLNASMVRRTKCTAQLLLLVEGQLLLGLLPRKLLLVVGVEWFLWFSRSTWVG
jgi:hypothetical protein